jgi:F-type H+-transporting ATPase subunit b
MPQFDVSTFYSQIFWLSLVFSFLYIVVLHFISPVTEQIFEKRKIVISSMVLEAEQLAVSTETLKKEYNISHQHILNEAEKIRKDSLDNLSNSFADKNKNLLAELDKKRETSSNEIELELKDFVQDQSQSCIDLADFIIQNITNKKSDMSLLNKCYERVQ